MLPDLQEGLRKLEILVEDGKGGDLIFVRTNHSQTIQEASEFLSNRFNTQTDHCTLYLNPHSELKIFQQIAAHIQTHQPPFLLVQGFEWMYWHHGPTIIEGFNFMRERLYEFNLSLFFWLEEAFQGNFVRHAIDIYNQAFSTTLMMNPPIPVQAIKSGIHPINIRFRPQFTADTTIELLAQQIRPQRLNHTFTRILQLLADGTTELAEQLQFELQIHFSQHFKKVPPHWKQLYDLGILYLKLVKDGVFDWKQTENDLISLSDSQNNSQLYDILLARALFEVMVRELPSSLDPKREIIDRIATSLVGKITYDPLIRENLFALLLGMHQCQEYDFDIDKIETEYIQNPDSAEAQYITFVWECKYGRLEKAAHHLSQTLKIAHGSNEELSDLFMTYIDSITNWNKSSLFTLARQSYFQ